MNNRGGFGKGFVLSVAEKYPIVKDKFKHWYKMSFLTPNTFHLGNNQYVAVDENLTFVNMLAQDGYKTKYNPVPLSYEALRECLIQLNYYVEDGMKYWGNEPEIWMPKIGAGLGGGNWDKIERMINIQLKNRKVIVFEYE